jgi:putative glycosyltransferase (TIGR04372 family)
LLHRLVAAALRILEPIFARVLYLCRVRFLQLTVPGRIGHLCTDPGTFVKKRILGMEPWYYGILVSPPSVGDNQSLLGYWRRHLGVVRSVLGARIVKRLSRFTFLNYDAMILAFNETAHYIAVERAWGTRPPLLALTGEHRARGRAWLESMGVPAGAEFVCIHNREAGYSPSDDGINTYRNSSVANYLVAAEELVRRGYWCVRMGGPTQSRLPKMQGVIDYAHLDSRSDWLDVFLCAECKFFLGASSGLLYVSTLFGRPVAAANQAPFSTVLAFSAIDVAIPKLLWSESENRYLTFRETFDSDVSNLRFAEMYGERGERTVENSGEELRTLALEVLDRVNGIAMYEAKDEELQRRFLAMMRPGHYGYGGINRVGRDFLRKYESLFGDGAG